MSDPHRRRPAPRSARWPSLLLCQVGAMTVWFSSASVVATVKQAQAVSAQAAALLTSALQVGFVAGTVFSAVLSLAEPLRSGRLFMVSALVAARRHRLAGVPAADRPAVCSLRFPHRRLHGRRVPGRHAAGGDLGQGDLGLLVGFLVGALTLGSASPHLLAASGGLDWRLVYGVASACAALAGVAVLGLRDRPARGPRRPARPAEVHAGLARPGGPAGQPGLPGPHVGAVMRCGPGWPCSCRPASRSAVGPVPPTTPASGPLPRWRRAWWAPEAGGLVADRIGRTAVHHRRHGRQRQLPRC